jgi:hypothetical protein
MFRLPSVVIFREKRYSKTYAEFLYGLSIKKWFKNVKINGKFNIFLNKSVQY